MQKKAGVLKSQSYRVARMWTWITEIPHFHYHVTGLKFSIQPPTFSYVVKKELFLSECVILCLIINVVWPGFPTAVKLRGLCIPTSLLRELSATWPIRDTLVMIWKENCVICPEVLVWGGCALWDEILKPLMRDRHTRLLTEEVIDLGTPRRQASVPRTGPEAWREELCWTWCTPTTIQYK